MSSPRRILEDPAASSRLRSDLQSTVESETSYDPTAGFARLQRALAAAAASQPPPAEPASTLSAGGSASAGAAAGAAGTKVATKLLLAAAVGSITAVGYGVFTPPAERASTTAERPIAAQLPPAASTEARAAPPAAPESAAEYAKDATPPPSAAPHAEAAEPRSSSARAASQREIAQLVRIRALLERDPARAHRAILDSSREFPDGVFAEERAGLDVIALYRSGERQRAAAAARRFISLHPKSPLRARLEQILAGEAP